MCYLLFWVWKKDIGKIVKKWVGWQEGKLLDGAVPKEIQTNSSSGSGEQQKYKETQRALIWSMGIGRLGLMQVVGSSV